MDDRIRATIRTGESTPASNNTARSLASQLNEQKSHALNVVRDSVVAVDPQGHITCLNHAAEQFLGWTSPEVENRSVRTTLFAANKSSFDAAWREVRHKGEWRGTIAHCTKSGVKRLVESHWSAMYDIHSSKLSAVVMVGTENSNTNVTVADLAHEIRNPLAGIKGVAEAFLQRGQLTRQEREWMEAVRHEVIENRCSRARAARCLTTSRTQHLRMSH